MTTASSVTVCGKVINGYPHSSPEYLETARDLGYGDDTLAMCRDHDPLHVALCKWLGIGTSYALRIAAEVPLDDIGHRIAEAEEEAVMAVQRFARMAGVALNRIGVS